MGNSKERMDIVSNVGTPRFYVDSVNYQKALGLFNCSGGWYDVFGLRSPSHLYERDVVDDNIAIQGSILPQGVDLSYNINWSAVLGHNLRDVGARWYPEGYDGNFVQIDNKGSVVNSNYANSDLSGFGIDAAPDGANYSYASPPTHHRFYMSPQPNQPFTAVVKLGSLCYGKYYDMPFSPDLSLKMSREMGGIKQIDTRGGATLSNANWISPPKWGNLPAWTLASDSEGSDWDYLAKMARNGRRVWDLSWSYIDDSDLMPKIETVTGWLDTDEGVDYWDNTISEGTDFFSSVWNKTMGGHLPFIFQPDKSNNNPDQFAICRFDMDSFERTQVANNVYNISLKIRESW